MPIYDLFTLIIKCFIDRLHINLDTLITFISLFPCTIFYEARIGYACGCHYYLTNLNSLGHCIWKHQENTSAAAGLEPGTTWFRVNHATNEPSWRYIVQNLKSFIRFMEKCYSHESRELVTIIILRCTDPSVTFYKDVCLYQY